MTRFPDAIRQAINASLDNVHTTLPGRVETYNASKKSATIQPLIKKKFAKETLSMPVLVDVPVVFPSTQNAIISFPLAKGDGVLLLFSERDIDSFLSGTMEETEPEDPRKFSLSDAFCIPGLFSFGNPGIIPTGNNIEIKINNGNVEIEGVAVSLNGGGKKAARQNDLTSSTAAEDAIFWAWVTTVSAALNALVPGSVPIIPTAMGGKISTGSITVEVGD